MKAAAIVALAISVAYAAATTAQVRSSADYAITVETLDAAGLNTTSTNYSLHGSALGEFASGDNAITTSGIYKNKPGYVGKLSDMLDPIHAVSRLTHGSVGTFDLNLPVFSLRGVESRSAGISGNYTLVITFGNPLSSVGGVSASSTGGGPAPRVSGAIDSNDAHHYNVSLTQVPDGQITNVTLSNVMDAEANFDASLQVNVGFLIGDANGDGAVNSADATVARNNSGMVTSATNFRADFNVDGVINSADATIARSRSGTALPASPHIAGSERRADANVEFSGK